MNRDVKPGTKPAASPSMIIDAGRVTDVEQKQKAVAELLANHGYDGLLLQKQENFAWFSSGGDNSRQGSSEIVASLFITADARLVACNNIDSAQLFDRELPGLGFQLKERPWQEPRQLLVGDLCRGRKVASDTGFGDTTDISSQLTRLRVPLTPLECERMRELGRKVAHAVEATARKCWQGQTEAEVAGQLSHRLLKHQIIPERIQIWADGHGDRYRHWSFGNTVVDRSCVISAVGRLWGLSVAASRTVCFGEPSKEMRNAHQRTILMQSTGMYFSQPEWKAFEVWNRVSRIYEKFGYPNEWRRSEQAEVIGYAVNEVPIVPKSEFQLTPRMAVHWHPSIGPSLQSDTILIGEKDFEILTPMEEWPKLKTEVKGVTIQRPDILCREYQEPDISDILRGEETDDGDSILIRDISSFTSDSKPDNTAENLPVEDSIFEMETYHEDRDERSIFD